jgi:hypothetical protein
LIQRITFSSTKKGNFGTISKLGPLAYFSRLSYGLIFTTSKTLVKPAIKDIFLVHL